MRINSKLGVQHATFDGCEAGEGLAIFFSQNADDVVRYRFLVKAMIGEGIYQVGIFYSSPPNIGGASGPLTRMIGGAVCPGATSWAVDVSAVDVGEGVTPETAEWCFLLSRCFTAPIGVTRVNERYTYRASNGTATLQVLAGQTLKSWGVVASQGVDGFVETDALPIITVPNGFTVSAERTVWLRCLR